MERSLSPGLKKDLPKPKGRLKGTSKATAAEGALALGEKGARFCGSTKLEKRMRRLERRLALLERWTRSQALAADDKMQKALRLHKQAKELQEALTWVF